MMDSVCVYCASSNRSPEIYLDAAARLGRILAENGITIVYGGSRLGSMGRLAAAALEAGGKVIGVLPRFMDDLEWGHRELSELRIVEDMHERKRVMLELSGAPKSGWVNRIGCNSGYTETMKTASLATRRAFSSGGSCCRRLRVSRSRLYVTAMSEFLNRQQGNAVTQRLNKVYSRRPATVDRALHRAQLRSLEKDSC